MLRGEWSRDTHAELLHKPTENWRLPVLLSKYKLPHLATRCMYPVQPRAWPSKSFTDFLFPHFEHIFSKLITAPSSFTRGDLCHEMDGNGDQA